jgi:hypothetical protein
MWSFLFGWLVGSSARTARNTALPESVKQERYDAAMARRAERKKRRTPIWGAIWIVVLLILVAGPILGPVLMASGTSVTTGEFSEKEVDCGSVFNPRHFTSQQQDEFLGPASRCEQELSGRKIWGIILIVVGLALWALVAWIVVAVVRGSKEPDQRSASPLPDRTNPS